MVLQPVALVRHRHVAPVRRLHNQLGLRGRGPRRCVCGGAVEEVVVVVVVEVAGAGAGAGSQGFTGALRCLAVPWDQSRAACTGRNASHDELPHNQPVPPSPVPPPPNPPVPAPPPNPPVPAPPHAPPLHQPGTTRHPGTTHQPYVVLEGQHGVAGVGAVEVPGVLSPAEAVDCGMGATGNGRTRDVRKERPQQVIQSTAQPEKEDEEEEKDEEDGRPDPHGHPQVKVPESSVQRAQRPRGNLPAPHPACCARLPYPEPLQACTGARCHSLL